MSLSLPLLSVIVPVYNRKDYIETCLEAIDQQTYSHLDVILVNDGSDKAFTKYLKSIINQKEIRLINQKHKGAGAARNTGLHFANGTLITFVDSDDVPLPSYCENLVLEIEKDQADLVIGFYKNSTNFQLIKNMSKSKPAKNLLQAYLLGKIPIGIPAKIFRKSFLDHYQIRFPEGVLSEERHFMVQSLMHSQKVTILRECIYQRRIHDRSTMSTLKLTDFNGLNELLERDLKFLQKCKANESTILACYLSHYRVLRYGYQKKGYKNSGPIIVKSVGLWREWLLTLLFICFYIEQLASLKTLPFSRILYKILVHL